MKSYTQLLIWLGVVTVTFVVLWRKGYLVRLTQYVTETREELKKCSWPTIEELKGSTLVVMLSIVLLGGFTVLVDFLINFAIQLIMQRHV